MAFLGHKPDGTHKLVVDHINNNTLDNRIENLQLITQRENASKYFLTKKKSSQYTGVFWHKQINKWQAQIGIDGKRIHLGIFNHEHEAHLAYQKALEMYNKADLSFLEPKKYSSQYKGVSWCKSNNKWRAYIRIDGKRRHLGLFPEEYDAHLAYQKALKEIINN
jgi:uncharacterized protein YebE (UPF0316 family)